MNGEKMIDFIKNKLENRYQERKNEIKKDIFRKLGFKEIDNNDKFDNDDEEEEEY